MELLPIDERGSVATHVPLDDVAAQACEATVALYARTGFHPPWICYVAVEDGVAVGTCGFTHAPERGRVEIAYFTFPRYERHGFATRMAAKLVAIAAESDTDVEITAHTAPEHNASTRVLTRFGFVHAGAFEHPDDGRLWLWKLPHA